MARPETALRRLVYAATSAGDLYDLLRLAGCLTTRGRVNRSTVVTLMTRTRDALEVPYSVGTPPRDEPHDCLNVWASLETALTNAGYLQVQAWPESWKYTSSPEVAKRVDTLVDETRALHPLRDEDGGAWIDQAAEQVRAERRASGEPGPIRCSDCERALPDGAQFCVWCGAAQAFRCSCA
ncbi:MAG: zinc ribbon domain-containing protein [Chloroflexi bacterium]|nr:zinc ribbon domain-containing protein [Chloroflexota bacterium]